MSLATTPRAVVLAGPNGSGKSTLTHQLREGLIPGFTFPDRYINADDLARQLQQEGDPSPETTAFRMARQLRREFRERAVSFAYETVLSHPSGILDLVRLVAAGYQVTLFFVSTEDAELNVARVEKRVQAGGHRVAPDKIRSRYQRCLQFLPRIVEEAHVAWVFDATDTIRLCVRVESDRVTTDAVPDYLRHRLLEALELRAAARHEFQGLVGPDIRWISPDEDRGDYTGQIASARLPHACLQQTASDGFVCHDGALLMSPVATGEPVQLRYREGYATVIRPSA